MDISNKASDDEIRLLKDINTCIDCEVNRPSNFSSRSLKNNRYVRNRLYNKKEFSYIYNELSRETNFERQVQKAYLLILNREVDLAAMNLQKKLIENKGILSIIFNLSLSKEARQKKIHIKGLYTQYLKYLIKRFKINILKHRVRILQ